MFYLKSRLLSLIVFVLLLGGCSMEKKTDIIITENSDDLQEGYIIVTGGKIWYKIAGKNQTGMPLLIIHGGPGVSHDYLEPLEALADERPVIFYDQLGCGKSDGPADKNLWTIGHFVEELHQVRQALELKKCHILGQSWGCALAVDYMLTHQPAGVESLILSGPLLSASRWIADQNAYIRELPESTRAIILKSEQTGDYSSSQYQGAIMDFYRRHVCRLDTWPDCLNRSFETINFEMYKHMWGPSEFTVTGELNSYERTDHLNEIDIPVLFTCGEYDEATPTTTQFFQDHLPGSQIRIFENASHEHHLEKPQEYLQVIRHFMHQAEKS